MRRWLWILVVAGTLLVVFGVVDAVFVFGPLIGLAIWRIGTASLASLRGGAAHVPDGDPQPVDPQAERVSYWCEGCGAELLLLIRGTPTPPRHCGERMVERREILDEPGRLTPE